MKLNHDIGFSSYSCNVSGSSLSTHDQASTTNDRGWCTCSSSSDNGCRWTVVSTEFLFSVTNDVSPETPIAFSCVCVRDGWMDRVDIDLCRE
jgi:hypothetical protein